MDRYHEIKRENKKVVFLDWKWLIDCTNIGKIIDINNYLLPNIDTN